jgi:hypothetical protein
LVYDFSNDADRQPLTSGLEATCGRTGMQLLLGIGADVKISRKSRAGGCCT